PSTVIARNTTLPASSTSGTGPAGMVVPSAKPKLSLPRNWYVLPSGAASPTAATLVVVVPFQRNTSLGPALEPLARKATAPEASSEPGPTIAKVPPSGEASPTAATLTIVALAARKRN